MKTQDNTTTRIHGIHVYALLILSSLLLSTASAALPAASESGGVFKFTQPRYHGWALEASIDQYSTVSGNAMMGMWMDETTRNVEYSAFDEAGRQYLKVKRKTIENFNFLNVQVRVNDKARKTNNRTFTIRAQSADGQHETYCSVHVHVHDLNNLKPHFKSSKYKATIPEDSPVGTVITQVVATDNDRELANQQFYYAFIQDSNLFAIHPTSGRVVLAASVAHGVQAEHSVDILAIDRGLISGASSSEPKQANLIIKVTAVNRFAPAMRFNALTYSGASRNKTLAILECTDGDQGVNGKLEQPRITNKEVLRFVELLPGADDGSFLINLRQHPVEQRRINITFEVADRGSPSLVTTRSFFVVLPVRNAYIPVFNSTGYDGSLQFTVSEWSPRDTRVGRVAAWIPYGSAVAYNITGGNRAGVFAIDKRSGIVRLVKQVDRERKDEYVLTVKAYNADAVGNKAYQKEVVCYVRVLDANDNDPVFTNLPYQIHTTESDQRREISIFQVQAVDVDAGENGTVTYHIVDNDTVPLVIDPKSGHIRITGPLDSDTRTSRVFFVRVRAQDSGLPHPRSSDVYVRMTIADVNDNPPQFRYSSCEVECPLACVRRRGGSGGTTPFDVVYGLNPGDRDGDVMNCSLLAVGDHEYFQMNPRTCKLRIRDGLKDVEYRGAVFNVSVVATDSRLRSKPVPIIIQFTDTGGDRCVTSKRGRRRSPCIERCERDRSNEHESPPVIDSEPEVLFLNTSSIVNKHGPEIRGKSKLQNVLVREDAPVGSLVAHVDARDRDNLYNGMLWFTVRPEERGGDACFRVDSLTGEIFVARPLDHERTQKYTLTVVVTDLGTHRRSATAAVTISIVDINDNAPQFERELYEFEMYENATDGHLVDGGVRATDLDKGSNAAIAYSIDERDLVLIGYKFRVHPSSGAISLNGSLDRETKSSYRFVLSVLLFLSVLVYAALSACS